MRPGTNLHPAIVCDADRLSQIAIIQELGAYGAPVVAVSSDPQAAGFVSRYVSTRIVSPVPSFRPEYVEFLKTSAPRGVLFCSNDACVENLSQCLGPLRAAGFAALLPDPATLDRVVAKERLYLTALECGVAVPRSIAVHSEEALEAAVAELGFPVILKSTNLAGGIYRFVPSAERAGLVFREMSEIVHSEGLRHRQAGLMAQQWISQAGLTLWNFNACARGGEILSSFMGRRIRTDVRPDGTLGSSLLFGRTEHNPELQELNRRLLAHLRFDGIMETEWSRSSDGAWHLYDFNPRPSGNIRWGRKSGAPLAFDCYRAAMGLPIERHRIRPGTIYAKVLYKQSDWLEALRSGRLTRCQKAMVVLQDVAVLCRPQRHAVDVVEWRDIRPTLRAAKPLCSALATSAAARITGRGAAVEDVLRQYTARYLPYAVLTPTARFGLYAVAREFLSPGDFVLISPVTCHTVIDALMAAGVRPRFVDIELETGNIDVTRLRPEILASARALVSTNLYGNPDDAPELRRLADEHGLLFIEDCAHVAHTIVDGKRVGSFGDISIFSFKKYFDEAGGVVALSNEDMKRRLSARIAAETRPLDAGEDCARYLRYLVARALGPAMTGRLSALRRPRPADATATSRALLDPTMPSAAALFRVRAALTALDGLVAERKKAVDEMFARSPLPAKRSRRAQDVCNLVAPFFCAERDRIIAGLRRRGAPTYFLYSPPMNRVYPDLATADLDVPRTDTWSQMVLPVSPRFAREFLQTTEELAAEKGRRGWNESLSGFTTS